MIIMESIGMIINDYHGTSFRDNSILIFSRNNTNKSGEQNILCCLFQKHHSNANLR